MRSVLSIIHMRATLPTAVALILAAATAAQAQTARSADAADGTDSASTPVAAAEPASAPASSGAPASAGNDQLSEVVVTGSRVIKNGNQSPTPVTVIGVDDMAAVHPGTVADQLNDLPQFAGSRGQLTNPGGGSQG